MEVPASEGTTTASQDGAGQASAGPDTAGQAGGPDTVAGRYDRLAPV
jgi:hypothetical protein